MVYLIPNGTGAIIFLKLTINHGNCSGLKPKQTARRERTNEKQEEIYEA
jgi:hypothetical protein